MLEQIRDWSLVWAPILVIFSGLGGYFGRRWIEQRGKHEAIDLQTKLVHYRKAQLELAKQAEESGVILEELDDLKGVLSVEQMRLFLTYIINQAIYHAFMSCGFLGKILGDTTDVTVSDHASLEWVQLDLMGLRRLLAELQLDLATEIEDIEKYVTRLNGSPPGRSIDEFIEKNSKGDEADMLRRSFAHSLESAGIEKSW